MITKFECCFCGKVYEWYDGVYKNAKYNADEARKARRNGEEYGEVSGVFINANSFVLKRFEPLPNRDGDALDVKEADGNLEETVFNLCEDCMRELLEKSCPFQKGNNCFDEV